MYLGSTSTSMKLLLKGPAFPALILQSLQFLPLFLYFARFHFTLLSDFPILSSGVLAHCITSNPLAFLKYYNFHTISLFSIHHEPNDLRFVPRRRIRQPCHRSRKSLSSSASTN